MAQKLVKQTQRYKAEMDGYKEMAAKRREHRSCSQEQILDVVNGIDSYFKERDDKGRKYTVAGLLKSIGWNSGMWHNARDGAYDHYLEEFIVVNGVDEKVDSFLYGEDLPCVNVKGRDVLLIPYSRVVEYADLTIQEQREEMCLITKGNPAGPIFLLKSMHDFRESEGPSTVNNTLVVASKEKADEIMRLLK